VPKKNIRRLAGYPLIAYSIAAAAMSLSIERTIVSTDSEEIAAVARKFGADVPFLRPEPWPAICPRIGTSCSTCFIGCCKTKGRLRICWCIYDPPRRCETQP